MREFARWAALWLVAIALSGLLAATTNFGPRVFKFVKGRGIHLGDLVPIFIAGAITAVYLIRRRRARARSSVEIESGSATGSITAQRR